MEDKEARREIRRLLWRWGKVAQTCAKKQKELRGYADLMESVTDVHSSSLTGMPGGGKVADNTARAAEKLMLLEGHYRKMIDILTGEIQEELEFQSAIDELLESVKNPARLIIDMRYKYVWSYEKIARETSYSVSRAKALEGVAVDILKKNIKIKKVSTF